MNDNIILTLLETQKMLNKQLEIKDDEINRLRKIIEEPVPLKKTGGKKEKIVKKKIKNIDDEDMTIFIFKNKMLDYIDKNTIKYGCCSKYYTGVTGKIKLNDFFIDEIRDIFTLSLEKVLKDKTLKEKGNIARNILNNIFNEKIIYYSNYISTSIISDIELEEKIKYINKIFENDEYILKELNKIENIVIKTIKFEYSKNTGNLEKFELSTYDKIIKFIKFQKKTSGRIYYYKYDICNHYGENVYCIELGNIGNTEPQTAYSGISSYNNDFINDEKTIFKPIFDSGKELEIEKKLLSVIIFLNLLNKKIHIKINHMYVICELEYLKYINKSLEYLKKENILNFNKDSIKKLESKYDGDDECKLLKEIKENI